MDLPNGWVLSEWNDVATITHGKNQRDVKVVDGIYPIYGSGGIIGRSNKFLCKAGSTIVGRKGTINKPIFTKVDFWNIDTAFGVSPSEVVNPKYLYYFCMSFNFLSLDSSTTIPSLTQKNLLSIQMPLPPLAEQDRIVEKIDSLFSALDKGVEYLQTVKQQLKTYRQAVLKWAFEDRENNIKTTLSEIAEIVGGITKGRKLSNCETVYLPYLRVANVQDGYLDLSVMKEIEVKKDEIGKYLLKINDVLYTEGGDKDKLGRGTIWKGEIPTCVHQNHIFRARINPEKAIAKYVALYSQSQSAKAYFFANAKQTVNLASINLTVLKSLPLSLPSLAKQQEIVTTVETHLSCYDKLEQLVDESLAKADALRQSILKKSFEGRLVPQDPNDEPAEKLLERIKAERAAQKPTAKRRKKNG